MASTNISFDLIIEDAAPGLYKATAVSSNAGTMKENLEIRLEAADFDCLHTSVKGAMSDRESRQKFGAHLFERCFHKSIGRLWGNTLGKMGTTDVLHLRLQIDAADLELLPWELLYSTDSAEFLATSSNLTFSRYVAGVDAAPVPKDSSLRVLLAIADTRPNYDLPVIWQSFIDDIENGIQGMAVHHEVRLVRSANKSAILRTMEAFCPHILHVVAHGQGGSILLVHDDDKQSMVSIESNEFCQAVGNNSALRLVMLNVCQSANGDPELKLPGIGPALVARRIPAVIAMQYSSVLTEQATRFSKAFYSALGRSLMIGPAVNEARRSISTDDVGDRGWSTPILFKSTKSDEIVEIVAAPSASSAPELRSPLSPPARMDVPRELARKIAQIQMGLRMMSNLADLGEYVDMVATKTARATRSNSEEDLNDLKVHLDWCDRLLPKLADVGKIPNANVDAGALVVVGEFSKVLDRMRSLIADPAYRAQGDCKSLKEKTSRAMAQWRAFVDDELEEVRDRISSMT